MTSRGGSLPSPASSTILTGVIVRWRRCFCFRQPTPASVSLADTMTSPEIVFWRMLVSMTILMPYFAWKGIHLLKTQRPGMHAMRAVVNFGGMIMWFYAIGVVPLGKAVAIHFTLPLFLILLAVLFLGERVGIRRTCATVAGFCGTLSSASAGNLAVGWPEMMILGSAALYAGTVIFLKFMVKTEIAPGADLLHELLHSPAQHPAHHMAVGSADGGRHFAHSVHWGYGDTGPVHVHQRAAARRC